MASDALSLVGIALGLGLVLAAEGTFAYAAYWAFNIRRALTVRVYRNHALAVGLVSLGWIVIFLDYVVVSHISTVGFTVLNILVTTAFFYFIDAAVLDGRLSDPLLRDTLHWREIRRWVWVIYGVAAVASTVISAYYSVTTGWTLENPSLAPAWVNIVGAQLYIPVAIVVGLAALPITAIRSRDPLLRRQLEWFAAFIVILLAGGPIPSTPAYAVLTFLQQLGMAVCLYKSARSLAPVGRIPKLELEHLPG